MITPDAAAHSFIINLLEFVLAVPVGLTLAVLFLAATRPLRARLRAAAPQVGVKPSPKPADSVAGQLAALAAAKATRLRATGQPELLDAEIERLRSQFEKLAA
jgi:hypothetical protein